MIRIPDLNGNLYYSLRRGSGLEEQGVEVHTPWLHELVIVFPGPYLQGDRQIEQSGSPADVYESLNLGVKICLWLLECSLPQPRLSLTLDWAAHRWQGMVSPDAWH